MSAYLRFFQLERSPFDTADQSNLVLGTRAIRGAFGQIQEGLAEGAPRICVNGAAGMGKTSLARALPKLLSEGARVAVWPNPSLAWSTLRASIIKQLGLVDGGLSRASLMDAREDEKRLVLVIDAAENLEQETLDHLDILLGYRDDADGQLVHCVMLLNLEHARAGESPIVWWLDKLNTLQLEFAPLPVNGIDSYIHKHLKRAGRTDDAPLFSKDAAVAIHRMTGGVPRAVGELCERLLAEAAERGFQQIGAHEVEAICGEPTRSRSDDPPEEIALETEAPSAEPDREPHTASDAADLRAADDSTEQGASGTGLDAYFGGSARVPSAPTEAPAEIDRETPTGTVAPASSMPAPIPEAGGGMMRLAAAAVLVLALAAGGYFALSGDEAPETVAETKLTPTPPAPAAAPEVAKARKPQTLTSDLKVADGEEEEEVRVLTLEEIAALAPTEDAVPFMADLSPSDTGIDPSVAAVPVRSYEKPGKPEAAPAAPAPSVKPQ